jgi:hypothetical protein
MSIFSHFPFRRQNRRSLLGPGRSGRAVPNLRRRLKLERLEDRTVPSGNVISGYVFNDLNNNGLLDAGEKGIANVPVELLNASGAVIATAISDVTGYYQFTTDSTVSTTPTTLERSASVPASPTDWTQTLSIAQFDPALGTLTAIDIVNAGSITSEIKVENVDAAPATITATVSGSLTLSGAGFNALVTNGSSSKTFNAGPFDGTVDFGGTSGHDFGPQTATGSTTFTITSASDLARYIGTGRVSLSEVAHATSSASGAGNLIAQIATTAAAQVSVIYHYIPSASLRPGAYTIVETKQPPGFLDGQLSTNGNVVPNSVGKHSIPVTLSTSDLPNNDFAAVVPSSVAGYVYLDSNDNGVRDAGEAGIPGVAMMLTGSNDLGSVNLTAATAVDGSYQLSNLRPGNYTITETEPAGYLHGKDSLGSLGGTPVSGQAMTVTVGTSASGTNYNFGELTPGRLSGFVYIDGNNNGIKDAGEPGVAGVTITLTGTSDTGPVSLTTATAGDGNYQISNLRPGNYTIAETEPAGYLHGKNTLGSLGGTPVGDHAMSVSLSVGAAGTNYDFAELTPASLSGFVYLDANNNGVKDAGEPGIAGVTITLTGTNDRGTVNVVTTTAADGSYQFRSLRPGSYQILETEPASYIHGKNAVGGPGGTILNNLAMAVNLDVGIAGTNYDFAETDPPGSLAGYVYLDANGNGVRQPGDSGITGVTVSLTGRSVIGQSVNLPQTTAVDGSYQFLNVQAGTYTITESQPAGYIHGQQTLGTAGGTVGDHRFSAIIIGPAVAASNYDFAELLPASPPKMIFADSFAMPADFAHPMDVTILSKLQFLSTNNTLDPNVVAEATFVDGVYRHVLNRPSDTAGLISWVQALQNGASRAVVVSAVWNSAEHRGLEVDRLYETFLNRSPDPAGRAGWVNALLAGVSERDVARALLASTEFQAAHSDNASYVTALYSVILRRTANGAEVAGWVAALQNGVTRDSLAMAFFSSPESFQLVLDCAYTSILHRAPDPRGNQSWMNQLLSGQATPAMVCQGFLASDEFFSLARNMGTT